VVRWWCLLPVSLMFWLLPQAQAAVVALVVVEVVRVKP
jgi:hypothetical protein